MVLMGRMRDHTERILERRSNWPVSIIFAFTNNEGISFATRLVRAGVDLITVQHLLGHSKITMTPANAHSLADAKIEAVKKLEKVSKPDPKRTPEGSGQKDGEGTKLK